VQLDNGDFMFTGTANDTVLNRQGLWLLHTDPCGNLIKSNCTALHNNEVVKNKEMSFDVYPNPANNMIHISTKIDSLLNGILEMYDVNGNRVFQQICNHQKEVCVPVSHLPNGIYVVRVFDKSAKIWCSKKVIIRH
jgi:Secretion system C-terminal sorting domain